MIKILCRINTLIIFVVAMVTTGCTSHNSTNLGISTTPSSDSSLMPTETPSAGVLTSYPRTLTPDNAVATSKPNHLCEKVPEPELNNKTNSGNVYLSGKFYLCTYDGSQIAFDFDSGQVSSTESTNADIKLVISSADIDNRSLYFLQETNNSYVAVSQFSSPTQEYCEQQTAAANRLTLVLGSVGATGCVLTNEGRLAFFQVEQLDPFGLESVEVIFTTWNKK